MPEGDRIVIPDLQRIGKYDVLERIADGGFATLYRARDPFLKRLVAIKVCASEDPELRQQFLREAEIAGNLDHPAIVRTFDFGFDKVGPYLVQEYLHGEDLSQLIARRAPLQPRRKLDLLIQVAEGLAYSHAQQVLHLDIKPANVRVVGERQAKILDFGIARLATSGAAAPPFAGIVGGMVGTAGYLPPEQVLGKPLDQRADVFSFGALAFELLTYRRPYAGGTMAELLRNVLESDPDPLARYWPGCSDALDNLVGRCLRRSAAARFPGFDALLPELAAVRDGLPEPIEPLPAQVELDASLALAAPAAFSTADPQPVDRAVIAALAPGAAGASTTVPIAATGGTGSPARRRSRRAVAAAASALGAIALVTVLAFVDRGESDAAAPDAAPVVAFVPPPAAGAAPGLVLVTAAPWGEVARVTAADGAAAELPPDRFTPLRLWVAAGPHEVEVTLSGGEIATCQVQVVEGGTHVCHAAPFEERRGATEYWKEMGWWQ